MQTCRSLTRTLGITAPLALALACAPTAEIDEAETSDSFQSPPRVAFDPAESVIPIPNSLGLVNPTTGRLQVPPSCGESASETEFRTGVINELDGWPVTAPQPIDIPLTAEVDPASAMAEVLVINTTTGAPVSFTAIAATSPVLDESCNEIAAAPILRLLLAPGSLVEATNYVVLVSGDLKTASGETYAPSATWALIRQANNPIEIEVASDGAAVANDALSGTQVRFNVIRNDTPFDPSEVDGASSIFGINQLWQYHAQFLPSTANAASIDPTQTLVAFTFRTQTLTAPLMTISAALDNTAAVTAVDFNPLDPTMPQNAPPAPSVMNIALCSAAGAPDPTQDCGVCESSLGAGDGLPCGAVGAIRIGSFGSPEYLTHDLGATFPGTFDDPYNPTVQATAQVPFLYFEPDPAVAGPAPAGGWPVIIAQHGITRSKSDMFAIASQLSALGMAVFAFDWPLHGDRAIQISFIDDCSDAVPTANPECFYPFFSPAFDATRDVLRQSMIDGMQAAEVLSSCGAGTATCNGINVNDGAIGYIGQSLGSFLGTGVTALSGKFFAAGLNVGGASLTTFFNDTDSLALRCSLINALVAGGVIPSTSDCTDPSTYQNEPSYQRILLTAQWILDPGDPAAYAPLLAGDTGTTPFLIQQVEGDMVVPNSATMIQASLAGIASPATANVATSVPATPTAETSNRNAYINYPSGAANVFEHGSLLSPANETTGVLGTTQMQTDLFTYLGTRLTVHLTQ